MNININSTAKEKLIWLYTALGYNYKELPQSLRIPECGKRFKFNKGGDVIRVQEMVKCKDGKTKYITRSIADV